MAAAAAPYSATPRRWLPASLPPPEAMRRSWAAAPESSHPKALAALDHEDGVQGMGLFYMGYPEGEWPGKGHRKPLEYVTRWTTD